MRKNELEFEFDENYPSPEITSPENQNIINPHHQKVKSRKLPEIPESLLTPKISKKNEMYDMDSPSNNTINKSKIDDSNNNSQINQTNTLKSLNEEPSPKYLNFQEKKSKELTINKIYSYRRPFSKFKRKLIFILIFLLNILINLDHGAIPAGTTSLKQENNLDNVKLGIIGSLVYLGLIFGSISAGYIYSTYSSKWVLILSLFFSCFFLYFFTSVKTVFKLAFCRIGCGFFQVFCYIYFPLWVDQYGVNNQQTIWLTFLQLGVPLGTMFGYVIEAFSIRKFNNWKYAFYNQIFLILFTDIILIVTPDKFFSRNYRHSESTQEEIENEFKDLQELFQTKLSNSTNNKYRLKNINFINALYNNKYGRPSLYSIFSMVDDTEEESNKNYITIIINLLDNKKYIFTMLGISCMYFVVTGIQFWISDYMQEVMNIPSNRVYIIFALVCISAPTSGVLLGGFFIQYLGGYTNKKALDACFKITLLALLSGIFLPLFDYIFIFVIFMWLLLFFGGSVTPGLTGIMINSIPDNVKEIGNSVSQFFYNLIGYLPSPFLYGLVCKYTGGSKSRWGLCVLLLWACFGVLCIYFAKKYDEENEDDKNDSPLYQDFDDGKKKGGIEEKSNFLTLLFGRTSLV